MSGVSVSPTKSTKASSACRQTKPEYYQLWLFTLLPWLHATKITLSDVNVSFGYVLWPAGIGAGGARTVACSKTAPHLAHGADLSVCPGLDSTHKMSMDVSWNTSSLFSISTKLEKVCRCYVHDRIWAYLGYFCQVSFVFAHGVFACCFVRSRPVATGSFEPMEILLSGRGSVDYRGETRMKMGVSWWRFSSFLSLPTFGLKHVECPRWRCACAADAHGNHSTAHQVGCSNMRRCDSLIWKKVSDISRQKGVKLSRWVVNLGAYDGRCGRGNSTFAQAGFGKLWADGSFTWQCFGQGMFRPSQLLDGGATFSWLVVGRQWVHGFGNAWKASDLCGLPSPKPQVDILLLSWICLQVGRRAAERCIGQGSCCDTFDCGGFGAGAAACQRGWHDNRQMEKTQTDCSAVNFCSGFNAALCWFWVPKTGGFAEDRCGFHSTWCTAGGPPLFGSWRQGAQSRVKSRQEPSFQGSANWEVWIAVSTLQTLKASQSP